MSQPVRDTVWFLRLAMQQLTMAAVALAALGLAGYTIACATGHADWLVLPLTFGTQDFPEAGRWVQGGVTALALGLCFYLPANGRILALENSHRKFHAGMQDVARAYALAHRSDREGVFTLKSEFDSVRERIAFLRDHPDLAELEPSVIELAAQMSHVSRELAQTYSERNVARARDFLTARQQEIEFFNERIAEAKVAAVEIRRWVERVEIDEAVARSQLARLHAELMELLPQLAPDDPAEPTAAEEPPEEPRADNVMALPRAAE